MRDLNNSQDKMEISEKNARFDGFCLHSPYISYMNNDRTPNEKGIMNCREPLKEPGIFDDWAFIYSVRSQHDARDADEAIQLLMKAGEAYGVKFNNNVGYLEVENSSNIKNWFQVI